MALLIDLVAQWIRRSKGMQMVLPMSIRLHNMLWPPTQMCDAVKTVIGAARKSYLTDHITTIDHVENLTGINFLSEIEAINPRKEAAVESFKARELSW